MQKKLQLFTLLVIVLLGSNTVNSQTIFSEDFNGANSLANFTLINADGLTPQAGYSFFGTDAWITLTDVDSVGTMDSVAASTSWYTPAGTANDYLITPSMILTTASTFSFDARASDLNFPDGYEVLISNTTPDVAGLSANPVLLSVPAENAFWTRRTVDLSAYAGDTVYLAIRNNSVDRNILYVDNFLVEVGAITRTFDAAILGAQRLSEYAQSPLNQLTTPVIFAAAVRNVGTDTITNVELKYTVSNSGSSVFSDSTLVSFIAPGDDSIFVDFSGFIPNANGTYVVTYEVSNDSVDINLSNNVITSDTLIVTDFIFARDNDVATGALSIGAGTAGELGSIYELSVADTLTSVSVRITNAGGSMTNQPLTANIRSVSNGLPGAIIATSDTLIFPNVTNSFVDLTFNNAGGFVVLPADSFFVGVVEGDSAVTISTSATKFVANTNFVTFGATPWTPNENFNFNVTYMIRPTFGVPNLTVGLKDQKADVANLMVYPNPSNGVFNLLVTDRSTENNVDLKVIDAQGKTVLSRSLIGGRIIQEQVDLSAFEKGIYFIQLNTVEGVVNRKVILN